MSITELFVRRPPLVFVLLTLMGLAGTMAYRTLVQQQFPNVSVPTISVSVQYGGAALGQASRRISTRQTRVSAPHLRLEGQFHSQLQLARGAQVAAGRAGGVGRGKGVGKGAGWVCANFVAPTLASTVGGAKAASVAKATA